MTATLNQAIAKYANEAVAATQIELAATALKRAEKALRLRDRADEYQGGWVCDDTASKIRGIRRELAKLSELSEAANGVLTDIQCHCPVPAHGQSNCTNPRSCLGVIR